MFFGFFFPRASWATKLLFHAGQNLRCATGSVSQNKNTKFRKKTTLLPNAARPCVSGKYSSGKKELYSPTLCARASRENKVPEKKELIRQRCAPVCVRKFNFRRKRTLFANAVRSCVSGKKGLIRQRCAPVCLGKIKFRKKELIRQRCVPVCLRKTKPEKKDFIRQRCAPVCLGKIYFRKNANSIRQRCALVCLREKIRNKRALLPNAALPGVSDKYSCGKTYSPTLAQENQVPAKFIRQCCAPACLRKIKFRENRTLFANAARPRVSGKYSSGRKELYSPTLRAHVSRVPENICIRQRCAPECENNFIRQRCAPVCLRKRKFRKTRVSQNVVPEKMEPQEAN